jgi:hypothetical protein
MATVWTWVLVRRQRSRWWTGDEGGVLRGLSLMGEGHRHNDAEGEWAGDAYIQLWRTWSFKKEGSVASGHTDMAQGIELLAHLPTVAFRLSWAFTHSLTFKFLREHHVHVWLHSRPWDTQVGHQGLRLPGTYIPVMPIPVDTSEVWVTGHREVKWPAQRHTVSWWSDQEQKLGLWGMARP